VADSALEVEGLKVRTNLVGAEVSLAGGAHRRVDLYVAEFLPHSWRRQDLLDLLEDETGFLPARTAEGAWLLLNKRSIAWIALDRVEEPGEAAVHEELFDVKQDVVLELAGGEILEGQLLYTAPPARARVKDYMNEPGRYFRLYRQDRVYVINKSYLACVREGGGGSGAGKAPRG